MAEKEDDFRWKERHGCQQGLLYDGCKEESERFGNAGYRYTDTLACNSHSIYIVVFQSDSFQPEYIAVCPALYSHRRLWSRGSGATYELRPGYRAVASMLFKNPTPRWNSVHKRYIKRLSLYVLISLNITVPRPLRRPAAAEKSQLRLNIL